MGEHISGQKWDLTEQQIEQIGTAIPRPQVVADLLVACVARAQKDRLEKNPHLFTGQPTSADVDKMAAALVHHKAREIGGNLNDPNKQMLGELALELALQSAAWGTPREVVDHNLNLMKKVIACLPD